MAEKSMPSRSHHSAPKFDGQPRSLSRFLDDVEFICKQSGLRTEQNYIMWALHYLPMEENELWNTLPQSKEDNWVPFKNAVIALYPGAEDSRKYSISDLEMLSEKTALTPMDSRDKLGEYYRAFLRISMWLFNAERISNREISTLFLRGFDMKFRTEVRNQLRISQPSKHPDDHFSLKEINDAAILTLASYYPTSEIAENKSAIPKAAAVKNETFEIGSLKETMEKMRQDMEYMGTTLLAFQQTIGSQGLGMMNIPIKHNLGANSSDSSIPNNGYNFINNGCPGCSDPSHYYRDCPKIAEYVQKGLCKKDPNNQLLFSNGTPVSRAIAGKNLLERIDNFNTLMAPPISSSNVFGISMEQKNAFTWSIVDDSSNNAQVLLDENTDEAMDEIDEDEEVLLKSMVNLAQARLDLKKGSAQKSDSVTRSQTAASRANGALGNVNKDLPSHFVPVKEIAVPKSETQYKLPSNIEDNSIVESILRRSLDETISVTQRELLALSLDMRKSYKELLSTKRVPAAVSNINTTSEQSSPMVNTLLTSLPSLDGVIVANHSESLRCIPVNIKDKINCDALLDSGSQITALRKDLWEKLRLPIRSDHIMHMESANKTTNATMGLLSNLKVTVGETEFYMQVQVVEDAPYEMLLGRPFFTLGQAVTRDFANGDQHLTLTDPNTEAVITVSTHPRIRKSDF